MPRVSEMFPSSYLKADDLQGREVTVVIDSWESETLGEETRPVLYFVGKQKGLVLNKTNANMVAEIAGTDEMNDWQGLRITIYPTRTDFQGKRVPCIRVKEPPVAQAAGNGRPAGPRDDVPPPSDDDEPMPF